MNKYLLGVALLVSNYVVGQNSGASIPANTSVSMSLKEEVRESKKVKVGDAVKFTVTENVTIDGVVVIPKDAIVKAHVSVMSRDGDLRVDIIEVQAVDGTPVPLVDCWIFTTRAQNQTSRGALIVTGTRKTCLTKEKVQLKNSAGRF